MTAGWILYRCRKCGEQYSNQRVENIIPVLTAATFNERENDAQLTDVHSCKDGSFGISDLLGAVPEGNVKTLLVQPQYEIVRRNGVAVDIKKDGKPFLALYEGAQANEDNVEELVRLLNSSPAR